MRLFIVLLLGISTVAMCQESDLMEPLVITVQQGKLGAGGSSQAYPVTSGESFFIPIAGVTQPPAGVKPPNPEDLRSAQLAEQINNKVTQLQDKKREYDTELYIVHKAPLELERQDLERQLHLLEQEQEKLDAQKTITRVQQKRVGALQANQAPASVSGISVKAVLLDNNEVQLQFSSQQAQNVTKTILGSWTQIPGVQPETWVKVNRR